MTLQYVKYKQHGILSQKIYLVQRFFQRAQNIFSTRSVGVEDESMDQFIVKTHARFEMIDITGDVRSVLKEGWIRS